jgi:metal-sulfur cluster biosynthetic enzyme
VREPLEPRVREAVNQVLDPCSIGRGVPAGLVDMGMLCGLELEPREQERVAVRLTMRVTSPGCTFGLYFDDQLRSQLERLEEVESVEIQWSSPFDWSDDDMSDGLKERLRRKRELVLGRAEAGAESR